MHLDRLYRWGESCGLGSFGCMHRLEFGVKLNNLGLLATGHGHSLCFSDYSSAIIS